MQSLLVTGASGFVGSFIVERALESGYEVWAAVRRSSSRRWLQDGRIKFIELDLSDSAKLEQQVAHHVAANGGWDACIHAAGLTKCRHDEEFFEVNTRGTERLARALVKEKALTGKFVFVSSLSVAGLLHDDDLSASISTADAERPNTAYGRSKLQAERALSQVEGLGYTVLRPTGVYGPRERDYYMMAESINRGVDFSVGFKPQRITFIYVRDLVEAALLAVNKGRHGAVYYLSDGHAYSSREFSDLLQKNLDKQHVFHICAPLWVLRAVCAVSGTFASVTGRTSTLNMDKYKILKQRNWQCDITPAEKELGYRPVWTLDKGVAETVEWYKENGWI